MKHPVVSVVTGLVRPRWRGRMHTWAFIAAVPAALILIRNSDGLLSRTGATIYGISLVALFGVSAAYHRLARSPKAQQIMRRLDHSMIFVLTAGTYTPICLVALPPRWQIPMLALVWGLAGVGIAVKVWGRDIWVKASNALYLIIGWLALMALPSLIDSLGPVALSLLVLGGVLYTVGAVLFYLRRPDPHPEVFGYHEVWHLFTVLAGASHYGMVTLVLA